MTLPEALQRKIDANRRLPDPAERRAVREAVGLSQADIADQLGVTPQAVVRWEAGSRTPRGERLVQYVELLDELRDEAARA